MALREIIRSTAIEPESFEDVRQVWRVEVLDRATGHSSKVRVAQANYDLSSFRYDECRKAIKTDGVSAVESYLADDVLPSRILISTVGIHPAYDAAE